MKKIPLTQEKFALVDDIDFEYLNKWKWHVCNQYAARTSKRSDGGKKRLIYMHHVIFSSMACLTEAHIDHKNQNKLDNRHKNLRSCNSRSLQGANMPIRKGTSQFKGVVWHKLANKWMSHIMV